MVKFSKSFLRFPLAMDVSDGGKDMYSSELLI